MNHAFAFLLGFLCSASICGTLAAAYYLRALRRVRSIQQAIQNYQQAQSVVGDAISRSYPKP